MAGAPAVGASKGPSGAGGKGPSGPGGKRPGSRNPNDVDPYDQAAAVRENKRQLAAYDKRMTAAYEAGRGGKTPDSGYSDDEAMAHSSGAEEAAQPVAAPPSPAAPPGSGGGGGTLIKGEGAPALLGVVCYCLAINWLRYGWPGVTGWFSAKFVNKVTIPATATASRGGR